MNSERDPVDGPMPVVEDRAGVDWRGLGNALATSRSRQLAVIMTIVSLAAFAMLGWRFVNPANIRTVLVDFVSTGFIALGMMALLICGVFDLSVGSVYAVGMIVVAYCIKNLGLPWPLAVPVSLAVCAACGAVNGLLVTKMKINPLIATLGTMEILRGLAILIGGVGVGGLPKSFKWIGRAPLLGLALPVWLFFVTAVVFIYLFRHLKFFRKFYFVGGNKEAARLCGINANRIWFSGFVMMSLLAGLAGILYCARLGSSTGQAGMGLELKVIAGVVVGGASLKGGKGTILGGILGPLFMALVFNIMGILGVDAYWQRIVNGSILIFAVFTDVVMEHDYFKRRLGRKAG